MAALTQVRDLEAIRDSFFLSPFTNRKVYLQNKTCHYFHYYYIKKAFLSDQCKEIEENNRTGKTRDLFKKMRGTKGIISCKDELDKGQKWYGPNRSMRY